MKTRMILLMLGAYSVMMFSSCDGSKKTVGSGNADDVEITIPFKDFKDDKHFFRTVGNGESYDMNIARKMAITNAQSQIAASIQTVFDEVNTNYFNQHAKNSEKDLSQKFEGMSRSVVSQVLTDLKIKDSKLFKNKKTNLYNCFVAIEMPKESARQQLIRGISDTSKDRIDFDRYQYEKIFRDALEQYRNPE